MEAALLTFHIVCRLGYEGMFKFGKPRAAKEVPLWVMGAGLTDPYRRTVTGQDWAVVTGAVEIGFGPRANVARVRG